MGLLLLLTIPIVIGLVGFIWSAIKNNNQYLISLKEFLVLTGAVTLVVGSGYAIARSASTHDRELWNGRVTIKQQEKVSCEHSYPCNPYPCMCDDKGNCSTCWNTCYEHSHDYDWALYTTNKERIAIKRVDRRGSHEPPRFKSAKIGDPTAFVHSYVNYIKANPWTILRREGTLERFKELIPPYPLEIYDYHYVNRFIVRGANIPPVDVAWWNKALMELNADLGKKREVNIILVAVGVNDSSFIHALEEAWLGGKQNDFVIVLGVPDYPKITWARIMSWTRIEELKIPLASSIESLNSLDDKEHVLKLIQNEVDTRFVRTLMDEFEYLMATVEPPLWAMILLYIVGTGLSIGLTIFFYRNDPFDTGRKFW